MKYKLEYGYDQIELQKSSIIREDRIMIIDDLIATGGTAVAAGKLIKRITSKKITFMFVIDLYNLKGANILKKKGYNVYSIMKAEG